ncbi:chorismate mutase [Oscillospiraceae bacterium MB08-C2-2]|nr:chorismate mutase [Oscillospiraceae bacterium MB08-C2-2]
MDLDQLREQIDSIDEQLLTLFLQRMEIVEGVARYKLREKLPVLHSDREAVILAKVVQNAGSYPLEAERFFQAMLAISRDMQTQLIAEAEQAEK